MKLVGVQLSYFLSGTDVRRNIRALLKYVAFVCAVIALYAIAFHFIMLYVEGERHSWITGVYWTLTVMSTLGFGDITFESDIGRAFSIVVLISGIILLLIVLPFAFISYFYAPWLESRIRLRAPRSVPAGTRGHVILCSYDSIAPGLISRLEGEKIPYFLVEEDPERAADLHADGLSVIAGQPDSRETLEKLELGAARLVVVNREDTVSTNVILTAREVEPATPLVAIASREESVDVLELSGANYVLPLKKWLGEHLANRVSASRAQSQAIGVYEDLLIAEIAVHDTPLAGRTVRETKLRQFSGASIVGVWERGKLIPARPDLMLKPESVLVVIGKDDQMETLNELLVIYNVNPYPVVLIGGGRVGSAAARALAERGIPVNLVELDPTLAEKAKPFCNEVFSGDAADYQLLVNAGIMEAPSVVLTTNDDAMNIYLASYCRKLNPELRIASRITHDRNVEAIHRAGADFVLSYASLGAQSVFSVLQGREILVMGEGIDLFSIPVPAALRGRTLAETEIGARTGLTVAAMRKDGEVTTQLSAETRLEPGAELIMFGNTDQRRDFLRAFDGKS